MSRLHEEAISGSSHQSLDSLLSLIQPDGSFSDLNYGSDGSSSFREHGRRQGAFAYHYQNGEDVQQEVELCFTFITYDAPANTDSNWWGHVIGTPTYMWHGAVLARNIISPDLLNDFLTRYWVNTEAGPVWNTTDHSDTMAGEPADPRTWYGGIVSGNQSRNTYMSCPLCPSPAPPPWGNFAPRALLAEVEGLLWGESTFLNRHIEVKQEVKRELADRQPWGGNGLRYDGCLHQHCLHGDYNTENGYLDHTLALIYNGNYGKEMLKYLSNLFTWYTGTIYDYDEESIEGLFSAYLECNQWLFRGNVFEPTTTGRFITGGSTVTKIAAKDSVSVTGNYLLKLGRHQEEVQAALHRYDQNTPDVQYALVGHKHFFNSDLTVHQRRDYMASVRILSNRTSRQETWTSGQNKDGFFQADGFLTVVVDGSELGSEGQEVFMVYDWAKVPGVTNLYTTDIPQYQTSTYWAERCMNNAEFAGGVTDGVVGLASMDYNRPHVPLTALKSWFFFEDVIVVVGSRISLSEEDATGENVITTLAQVMYGGEHVLGKTNGEETILGLGETQHLSPTYLHHHSVGYVFLQGEENLTVSAAMQTLSSNELEVFTAWLNHGTVPSDSLLAYAILPSADLTRTRAFYASPEVELVEVSSNNHIVCHRPSKTIGGSIGTVGSISTPTCGEAGPMTLDVDTPCLVLLTLISATLDQAQFRITLSDPQQQFVHINLMLKYEGRSTSAQVTLPPPPKSGDSVFIFLSV